MTTPAERETLPPANCPKCGRPTATVKDFRELTLTGKCPAWYAYRDPDSQKDCEAAARKPTPTLPTLPTWNPKHLDRCHQESTRDVIFLFQRRKLSVIGLPDGFTPGDEGYCEQTKDDDGNELAESVSWSPKQMLDAELTHGDYDIPCVIAEWITEGVWLDREEAERYGNARAYNYTDGWRVYGVCAEGELAKALRGEVGPLVPASDLAAVREQLADRPAQQARLLQMNPQSQTKGN